MPTIVTLDFEASCLPRHGRSFPIEVAIAEAGGEVRSWLIRPEPQWRAWAWTAEAEGLHGLTWDQLIEAGRPAAEVLDELATAMQGRPAYADSYLDATWMCTLEAAAGAPPLVRIRHIDALIDALHLNDAGVARALSAAADPTRRRHRAGDDALWLQIFAQALAQEAGSVPDRLAPLAA